MNAELNVDDLSAPLSEAGDSVSDQFRPVSPEEPSLFMTNARVFGSTNDPKEFSFGSTSVLPSGDINPENFAAFSTEMFKNGYVRPGGAYRVVNPKTHRSAIVIARHAEDNLGAGIAVAPHVAIELGTNPTDAGNEYMFDTREIPESKYPRAPYPPTVRVPDEHLMSQGAQMAPQTSGDLGGISMDEEKGIQAAQGGEGPGSETATPSSGPAKWQVDPETKDEYKTNPDGSETYKNGVTFWPTTGAYSVPVGGGLVSKWAPGMKSPQLKKAGDNTSDEDAANFALMKKKGAEKGIVRQNYKNDEEYMQALKSGLGAGEASGIADAIMRGDQPPTTQGLYRQGPLVKAELARRGYNLSTAMTDWNALQKYTAAANSTPIFKLRASAETAYHSLDLIDEFAKEWKANAHMPILNKANIIAAKNGAYGKDAQVTATKLDGQIADVLSEIAVVNQGGGVPNIPALDNAKEILKSEWDEKVLLGMTDLARRNLSIRLNSLKSIGPAGQSTQAQTGVQPTPQPSPTATPVAAPAATERTFRDKTTGRLYRLRPGGDPANKNDYTLVP